MTAIRPLGWVLAGVLALSGCGAAHPAGPPASALTPAALDLLTRSGGYAREAAVLDAAEDRLLRTCMAARGMHYQEPTAQGDLTSSDGGFKPDGSPDMAERRAQGYGLAAQFTTSGRATGDTAAASAGAAYVRALNGAPDDLREAKLPHGQDVEFPVAGCEADSRQRIYGSLTTWVEIDYIPQRVNASLDTKVAAAPAYTGRMRQWASCMKTAGHPYATPTAAITALTDDYRRDGVTDALRRTEIAVATADGDCAERLGVTATALAARRHLAPSALSTHDRLMLDQLAREWQAAAAKAPSIDAS